MTYIKLILIGVVTSIASVFAMLLVLIDRSFTLYFYLDKLWSKSLLLISGINVKTTGLESVEPGKSYVYVSNHSSLFDIPVLQSQFIHLVYIVFKRELAKIPLFGWHMLIGPYVVINRQNAEKALKSIERAKEAIEKKRVSVILFAEGTRSKTGEVQPFKRGAFHLAAVVNKPIIPVSVAGTDEIMPKGKFQIKSGNVRVHFGDPIDTGSINGRKEERELMEKVRDIIIENRNKIRKEL